MELFYRIFCFISFLGSIQGQQNPSVSLRSAADTIALGEPFTIEIDLKLPERSDRLKIDFTSWTAVSNALYLTDTIFYDKTVSVDILSSTPWKQLGQLWVIDVDKPSQQTAGLINTVSLAIFEAGEFLLPVPRLLGIDSASVLYGAPVNIFVRNPVPPEQIDSLALRPIRDIHREPANWSDYIWYLLGLMVVILSGLSYWWWKRRTKTIPPNVETPPIPSWEAALNQLQVLDRQELWQQGRIKEYQDQLTTILRTYLEDRFEIPAPELTTEEITSALSRGGLSADLVREVSDILQVADLVKFARATPEEDIHSRFMQRTILFVNRTIPPLSV